MNIALIGYGNMGKTIEKLCEESDEDHIISISYQKGERVLDKEGIKKSQVAIDFTEPGADLSTITEVLPLQTPLVIGTTGWFAKLPEVEKLVKKHHGAVVYGGNFSIGANIFFKVVSYASSLFATYPEYDVYGFEIHHAGKKDSPSGTAKQLAEEIMQKNPRKKIMQSDKLDRKVLAEELHIPSIRGGYNNGRHDVFFESPSDTITLSHQAHSRIGFAKGALLAAHFLQGKKGIYRFDELFSEGRNV